MTLAADQDNYPHGGKAVKYRRVSGMLIKPGDVLRHEGRIYKIESIDKINVPGDDGFGALRAETSTAAGPRQLLISPDLYYDVRQLPADVQMAQFISQMAPGQHDASWRTVDEARKLLDNIAGESPFAAVNEQLQEAQDVIERAVTDGAISG